MILRLLVQRTQCENHLGKYPGISFIKELLHSLVKGASASMKGFRVNFLCVSGMMFGDSGNNRMLEE